MAEVEKKTEEKKYVRVAKPDKAAHQAQSDALQAEIDVLTDKSKLIKIEIDKILSNRNGPKSELDIAKAEMTALSNSKKQLMTERAAVIAQRDALRDKINAKQNEEKAARNDLKYNSVEAIDTQIKELERKQATQSMTLQAEKQILKDISSLRQSKKTIGAVSEMKEGIEKEKQSRANLDRLYHEKNAELKVVNDKIAPLRDLIDNLNKNNNEVKEEIPNLRKTVQEYRDIINSKYAAMKQLRAEFKKSEEVYYTFLNEEKQRKKEEHKKYLEAKAAEEELRQKELEALELARVPYEDEMNLIDFLVKYLEAKSIADSQSAAKVDGSSASSVRVSAPLEGMKLMTRTDDEYVTFGKKSSKKKSAGGNSKKRDIIVHGVDTIKSFSSLDLVPPNVVSDIANSIEELKAKKAFYQNAERGSVPTIASKAKEEQSNLEKKQSAPSSKKASVFNLDSDFPDLSIRDSGAPGLSPDK